MSLTAAQAEEFRVHQFKSRLPIMVTGRTSRRASNLIVVGDAEVLLSDRSFLLFERLIVQLFATDDGCVFVSDLVAEGLLSPTGTYQAVNRLRDPFYTALRGLDPVHFIEVFQPKTLRLSTHRALIRYDSPLLRVHHVAEVRDLATRLPNATGSKPKDRSPLREASGISEALAGMSIRGRSCGETRLASGMTRSARKRK